MNNNRKNLRNSNSDNSLSNILKHPESMTSSEKSMHSIELAEDSKRISTNKSSKSNASNQQDSDLTDLKMEVAKLCTPEQIHQEIKNHLLINTHKDPKGNYLMNFKIIIFSDPKIYENLRIGAFSDELYLNVNGKPVKLTDSGLSTIRIYIEKTYEITPSKDSLLVDALHLFKNRHKKQIPKYNPIDEELLSKQPWDHKERDKFLFSRWLGAKDNSYTRAVAQKFLCGAVNRALHPGGDFPLVPMLSGKTGIGKSTLVKEISGYRLYLKGLIPHNFYSPNLGDLDINNPETQRKLITTWMFELPELAGYRKTKISKLKAFFTSDSMSYRPLYQNTVLHVPVHSVFIGTTNVSDYLVDDTGNRRYFPIQCATKLSDIKHWSYNMTPDYIYQLWAEARYKLCKYGSKSYEFSSKQNEWIEKHIRKNFEAYDPLSSVIKSYLNLNVPNNWSQLSVSDKYYYYRYYHSGDKTQSNIKADYINVNAAINDKHKQPISFVQMDELIKVSCGKWDSSPARASKSSISHKIRLIMANICDNSKWHKSRKRINNHNIRGWYIKRSSNTQNDYSEHHAFKTNNGYYGLIQVGQNVCGKNHILGRLIGGHVSRVFDLRNITAISYPEYSRHKHNYDIGFNHYF